MADLTLTVGRVYRGKRIRNCHGLVNDRVIKWIDADSVQFDSPSIAAGRHYPVVSKEKFLAGADRDVTDELPEGLWADYPPKVTPAALLKPKSLPGICKLTDDEQQAVYLHVENVVDATTPTEVSHD